MRINDDFAVYKTCSIFVPTITKDNKMKKFFALLLTAASLSVSAQTDGLPAALPPIPEIPNKELVGTTGRRNVSRQPVTWSITTVVRELPQTSALPGAVS